jgi:hypothetical protein
MEKRIDEKSRIRWKEMENEQGKRLCHQMLVVFEAGTTTSML